MEPDQRDLIVGQLQQELLNRSMPRIAEMIDALNAVTRMAAAGSPPHKQVLQQFFATLDAARDASGRLTVVRNGGAPPSP